MSASPNTKAGLPIAATLAPGADEQPRLFAVVDTEEEFDWDAPFSRSETRVTAMRHIDRAQRIFDRYGIRPMYVMDYPVASQPEGAEPLREIHSRGGCYVGAHLHPWVNPPYTEDVTSRNSFTCNLDPSLQRAKLQALASAIAAAFGEAPRIFKAGRYGLGAATVTILEDLGFEIDNSVSPRFDFRAHHGPSFAEFDTTPFFLTERLLEIPCTVDYIGWLGPLRPVAHRIGSTPFLERCRALGVLSRLGAVNRIMLSPEGNTFEEMRALTTALLSRGCRTFTLSFHSPSVAPGHTPYVRSQADLDAFLRVLDRFCEFFMKDVNGTAVSPYDFRRTVSRRLES